MKKIIAVLMSVMMLVGILAMYPVSASDTVAEIMPDYTWYDAEKTEFVITTEAQLLGLGYIPSVIPGVTFEGKTIKLGDNIVLNKGNPADWKNNPPANSLTALPVFCGTFDGQGYSISGAYGDGSSRKLGLLFGEMSGNACVKNLAIVNSYFVTASTCGGITGRVTNATEVRFENVYVDVLMEGDAWEAGGFVGNDYSTNQKVVFNNCVFAGEFKMLPTEAFIGGFIGYAGYTTNGTIEFTNCLNVGKVHGQKRVGGFVGLGDKVSFDKCVNLGPVVGETGGKLVAGIVGEGKKVTMTDCYTATDVMTMPFSDATGNSAAGSLGTDSTCACVEITTATVKGAAAATVMDKLDWTNTWTTQDNALPTLKFVPVLLAKAAEGAIDENGSNGNAPGNDDTTNNDTGDTETETKATETTTPATEADTTEADTTEAVEEKGGCGASVAIGSVAVVCLGAAAFLAKKKKED